MTPRRYPRTIKARAWEMVVTYGMTRAETARELEIPPSTIYRWIPTSSLPSVPGNELVADTAPESSASTTTGQLHIDKPHSANNAHGTVTLHLSIEST
ncbi:transposase [Corynebacterium sp.]|uniref:transposase n=1 Tax=Corynebacterium sp. TaxID=1720 RepID=UPI003B3BDD81